MAQNPTRRNALRFGLAPFAAGLAAPTLIGASAAAVANPDGELIRLCARIVAVEAAQAALFAVRHSLEDETRTDPEMNALHDEREQIFDQVCALPKVTTMEGAQAMARASLALARWYPTLNHDFRLAQARCAYEKLYPKPRLGDEQDGPRGTEATGHRDCP
jgi:hypothetical protein